MQCVVGRTQSFQFLVPCTLHTAISHDYGIGEAEFGVLHTIGIHVTLHHSNTSSITSDCSVQCANRTRNPEVRMYVCTYVVSDVFIELWCPTVHSRT